jgi:hypothetical protein
MTITTWHPLAVAAGVGLLAGTHAAIWGMYKDAVHEGFTVARFARSVVVGAAVAVVVQAVFALALPRPAALVVLFGLAYAAERGVVEVWKTFVREEDQSKYHIPMQLSVRGVPVAARRTRLAVGAAYVLAVALCLGGIARLDHLTPSPSPAARFAIAGLCVGAIVAIGGAWKDAPKEGFDALKFLRSPALTVGFALLLSQLTESHLQAAVGALGYERATAETYKTFFFPARPRGKFAGKPIRYPEMLTRRRYFVPLYVAICAAVLASGMLALREVTPARSAARPPARGARS